MSIQGEYYIAVQIDRIVNINSSLFEQIYFEIKLFQKQQDKRRVMFRYHLRITEFQSNCMIPKTTNLQYQEINKSREKIIRTVCLGRVCFRSTRLSNKQTSMKPTILNCSLILMLINNTIRSSNLIEISWTSQMILIYFQSLL